MILLLWAAWRPESDQHQRRVGAMSMILVVAVLAFVLYEGWLGMPASDGPIAVDPFRWLVDVILLLGTLGTIALSMDYNEREGITAAESHVLVLLATSGMMLLAAARDLMIVFLGIELMSVSVYVLAGLNRRSGRSAEGALKYFLLGAFSTAFLLYGIALVYGATGSTMLSDIGSRIIQLDLATSPLLLIGVALMLVGMAFKVAAVPFHMWAPDVYDGAPTPITAYMAAAVKAAAFASFLRIWYEAFPTLNVSWHLPIWWIAVATMVVGNLVALTQKNIKRMLAYSSIAHAGYVLVAVIVGTSAGTWAFLFYLLAYTLATLGAFAVVSAIGETGEKKHFIEDYAGLWSVRPWMAAAMAVFMLALLGFPIFGGLGFLAKWFMLKAALQAPAPQTRLAVAIVLTSVVSAGYYLYVVMVMFMRPRTAGATPPLPVRRMSAAVIAVAAALILIFGIYPNPIVRWTQASGLLPPTTGSIRTTAAPIQR
jgi:NADH-quinone oxidoreductase subunit N